MKTQTKNAVWQITKDNEIRYFISAEKVAEYLGVTRNSVHLALKLGHKCRGYAVGLRCIDNVVIYDRNEEK